ncbi:MAG: diguanylate cyclase [Elusimicrobia bacterium]|nr:diguanylate cyclase [Elusimicrobiota bacterium]
MIIAITSLGETPDSGFSEKFGRAPYFVIYDTSSSSFIALKNSAVELDSGAGPQAVRQLSVRGVNLVLTGHLGGNAAAALEAAGIKAVTGFSSSKTVNEVLNDFRNKSG